MKILMICLGNICRSPLAEGILRNKLQKRDLTQIIVDSAGIGAWHLGEHPDSRAIKVAKQHGIDISKLTARKISESDFDNFDKLFIAADAEVYAGVLSLARNEGEKNKIEFLLNALYPNANRPVPDPYFGDEDDFENVFQLLDEACDKIVESLTVTKKSKRDAEQ